MSDAYDTQTCLSAMDDTQDLLSATPDVQTGLCVTDDVQMKIIIRFLSGCLSSLNYSYWHVQGITNARKAINQQSMETLRLILLAFSGIPNPQVARSSRARGTNLIIDTYPDSGKGKLPGIEVENQS